MSLVKVTRLQLGQSSTATQNFTLDASDANGTMKLARGNAGATTQDIITVDASGNVTIPGSLTISGGIIGQTFGTYASANPVSVGTGTSYTFTGIPAGVKRATVIINGASTANTSPLQIRLGTSGGIIATGYKASAQYSTSKAESIIGIPLVYSQTAAYSYHSKLELLLTNPTTNEWIVTGFSFIVDNNIVIHTFGIITLNAPLTQLMLTTEAGNQALDAGTINMIYEV